MCHGKVNRDLNGAINIGINFMAMFYNEPQLVLGNRAFSPEDEFHQAQREAHLLMAMEDDDLELERGPEDDPEEDVVSA